MQVSDCGQLQYDVAPEVSLGKSPTSSAHAQAKKNTSVASLAGGRLGKTDEVEWTGEAEVVLTQ